MYNTVEVKTKNLDRYLVMQMWCVEQFGMPGNYVDDTWNSRESIHLGYALFFFEYAADATLFTLRWA